ncbi:MAG: LD-carboxypeptidase [Gammaproteobacteria bacterium]
MTIKTPRLALIRTGSACKHNDDPEHARIWLAERYHLVADYHPDTQAWLSPEQRAQICLNYLLNDDYDVLWLFRGGEGTADILPFLHAQMERIKQAKPKLLLGFSDFTAIGNYFNQTYDWPVIHGPNVVQTARERIDAESIHATMPFLSDLNAPLMLTDLHPFNQLAHVQREVVGKLCGGNLSVLAISIKDIWEIQSANKILIIEDVDERPHKIARTLNYFQRIGIFSNVRALIFGDFIYHHEEEQQAIMRTLHRFAASCNFPVLHTVEFGHGKRNMPLPFYREAHLHLGERPKLWM